jgi:hypothetical protein
MGRHPDWVEWMVEILRIRQTLLFENIPPSRDPGFGIGSDRHINP